MSVKHEHTFCVIIYMIINRVNKMLNLNVLNISEIKNLHKKRCILNTI